MKHREKRVATAWSIGVANVLLLALSVSAGEEEQKLLDVLKSDSPIFDKAKACQRLTVAGTKAAVPVLAGLLANEELAHCAWFGLEPIPDPSVDEAFKEAMGRLKGRCARRSSGRSLMRSAARCSRRFRPRRKTTSPSGPGGS